MFMSRFGFRPRMVRGAGARAPSESRAAALVPQLAAHPLLVLPRAQPARAAFAERSFHSHQRTPTNRNRQSFKNSGGFPSYA
jgi:hypothetical protein